MVNFDDPGFPIALLAILGGLRIAVYAAEVYARRAEAALTARLSPDAEAEEAVAVEELPSPAIETAAPTEVPPPASAPRDPASAHRFWAELLDSSLIAVVLVFFIIRPFVLQAFFIPTGSMIPTLQEGDRLLALKYSYRVADPHRRDIVVFQPPELALRMRYQAPDPQHPVDYVKRVVGIPGDRIRIVSGDGVYVNGVRQQEPYVAALPDYNFPFEPDGEYAYQANDPEVQRQIRHNAQRNELVVPDGYLFVLGDNRQDSHDSHRWGLLPRERLVGKAVFIFWPPKRFGVLK